MEEMLLLRDWSNLPADATRYIACFLEDDLDYVRFRSVCTSWFSATTKRPLAPWLIFRKSASLQLCSFPNTDKIFPSQLPEDVIVCGSSFGWIFVLDDTLSFYICNPFSGRRIPLPPLPEMPYRVIRSGRTVFLKDLRNMNSKPIPKKHFHDFQFAKPPSHRYAVMSSDPATSPDDCIVVTQTYRTDTLIHCRPGDTCWTPLSGPSNSVRRYTFYKGQLYGLSGMELKLFVCPIEPGARVREILPANPLFSDGQTRGYEHCTRKFLEVFYEDLLFVAVYYDEAKKGPEKETYEIFRVDLDGGQLRLVKLETLGGRALFLGCGGFNPGNSTRCRGNCVYDNLSYLRLFNMEDGGIEYIVEPSGAGWGTFIAPNL